MSGLFRTTLALIDSFVKIISSIEPTSIPLYVTGDFFDRPLAFENSANRCQFLEDNFIPLNQKENKENIMSPPNKEKPTIESRKLLRISFKSLLVALDHQGYHF